jgi:DNA-binding LytR/AlgR family response regulator
MECKWQEEFIDSLKDAINEPTKNDKVLVECIDGTTSFVRIKEILYIEYIDRKTIARTRCATYETRRSLKEWEDILDNGAFFRTHKAYIVNLAHVEEIGTDIIMENGEKVEISVRQMSKLKKVTSEYGRRKVNL